MKILALDVDGVLNQGKKSGYGLQHESVEELRRIVKETGCNILITSTWREHASGIKRLTKLCQNIGATLFGFTPNLKPTLESGEDTPKFLRESELQAFLDDNLSPCESINLKLAILDDHEPFMNTKILVKPDGNIGLTRELADQVIKLLS